MSTAPARRVRGLHLLEAEVARWNDAHPIGTAVNVRRDCGDTMATRTRSLAWVLSGHTAVIMVDGISGCYALRRVTASAP